jgi:hypothetical protein
MMAKKKTKIIDFTVSGDGSVYLLNPNTEAARQWVSENLPDVQSWQYMGTAIAIEHRYIVNIVEGIKGDGLVVDI